MSLKTVGSALTAGLGVASWSRALLFTGGVSLLTAAGAFYFAVDWQQARAARTELQDVLELLDAQQTVLDELRGIRTHYAQVRADHATWAHQRMGVLADWLALPGLGDSVCLDPFGVGLWNAATAGTAAGPATGRPPLAMPDAAAAGTGQPQGSDGQGAGEAARAGGAARPGLPAEARGAGGLGRDRDAGPG